MPPFQKRKNLSDPYVKTPMGIGGAYDGEFITSGIFKGTGYMVRKLNGYYYGIIPGSDVENVNNKDHNTILTARKQTKEEAEKAVRSIAKHLPRQHDE